MPADGVSAIHPTGRGPALRRSRGERHGAPTRPPTGPPGAAKPPGAPAKPQTDEERILVGLPAALWRELRPGADSALDRHIGGEREVAWTSFHLDELKAIEHAAGEGVTVNDVVLAIVAGALRRWLEGRTGSRPFGCRFRSPSTPASDKQIGNRDSYLNVDLPIGEARSAGPAAGDQLRDPGAQARARCRHAVCVLPCPRPLPAALPRGDQADLRASRVRLSVSNVPGPRRRPSILGHGVEQFCSFAEPADRHALRVSVMSLGGSWPSGSARTPTR